jgi:hypothetical protein
VEKCLLGFLCGEQNDDSAYYDLHTLLCLLNAIVAPIGKLGASNTGH